MGELRISGPFQLAGYQMTVFERSRELVLIVLVVWLFVYLIDNTSTEGRYAGAAMSLPRPVFGGALFLG